MNFSNYGIVNVESIASSLDLYVNHGIETGSFLRAVLANDLFRAVQLADTCNIHQIPNIVKAIYNELPYNVYGSYEAVGNHLASFK